MDRQRWPQKKKKNEKRKESTRKNSDARVNSVSLLYSCRCRPNHIHNLLSSTALSAKEKEKEEQQH
jgi:hypothetical protein